MPVNADWPDWIGAVASKPWTRCSEAIPSSRSAAGHQALNSPILGLVVMRGRMKFPPAFKRPATTCGKRAQMTVTLLKLCLTHSPKKLCILSNGLNNSDIANFIYPFIIYF